VVSKTHFTREHRPQASVTARVLHRLLELPDLFARFALCLMNVYGDEKDPAYWLRRADEFEAAAPRPSDFHGGATHEDLDAAYWRCLSTAKLCRERASLLQDSEEIAA
jgi:hypothetical protein